MAQFFKGQELFTIWTIYKPETTELHLFSPVTDNNALEAKLEQSMESWE